MICCDPFVYVFTACLVLILPIDWLLSVATAALVHEFSHVFAVKLLRGKIQKIHITVHGCMIACSEMRDPEKILSILAGPAGSFFLLLFRHIFPQIAAIGLLQGVFNLIPILPLDGGRILQLLLYRFIPEKSEKLLRIVRDVTACLILLCGLYVFGRWGQ